MISTMEDATSAPGVQHLIQVRGSKRLTIRGFIVGRESRRSPPGVRKSRVAELAAETGELVSRADRGRTVWRTLVDAFLGACSPGPNVARCSSRLSDDDAAAS